MPSPAAITLRVWAHTLTGTDGFGKPTSTPVASMDSRRMTPESFENVNGPADNCCAPTRRFDVADTRMSRATALLVWLENSIAAISTLAPAERMLNARIDSGWTA